MEVARKRGGAALGCPVCGVASFGSSVAVAVSSQIIQPSGSPVSGSLSHKRLLLDLLLLVMVRWCTLSLEAHRRWTWRGAALTCGSSSQYTFKLRIYVHSLADKAQKYGPAGPRCPLEFGLLQACDSMASSMSLAAVLLQLPHRPFWRWHHRDWHSHALQVASAIADMPVHPSRVKGHCDRARVPLCNLKFSLPVSGHTVPRTDC